MTKRDPDVLYQNPFSMTPDEFKAWWSQLDEPTVHQPITPPDVIYLAASPKVADTECD